MAKVYRPIGSKYIDSNRIACGPDMSDQGYASLQTCFDTDLRRLRWAKILPDGTDLNTIKTPGVYRSRSTASTSTMKNVPAGQTTGFQLIVTVCAGGNVLQDSYECTTQEIRRDSKAIIRHTYDYGETWSTWRVVNICNIGDVIITSTNTNPGSRLGGTWELIDQEFTDFEKMYDANDSSVFTPNTDNASNVEIVVQRSGHIIRIRFHWTTASVYTDTALNIGAFNLDSLGVTSLMYNKLGLLAGSDAGNGIVNLNLYNDGRLVANDVMVRGSTNLPSGSTPRITIECLIGYKYMLDSACNKFYWKRTA